MCGPFDQIWSGHVILQFAVCAKYVSGFKIKTLVCMTGTCVGIKVRFNKIKKNTIF